MHGEIRPGRSSCSNGSRIADLFPSGERQGLDRLDPGKLLGGSAVASQEGPSQGLATRDVAMAIPQESPPLVILGGHNAFFYDVTHVAS